jgi:hypothetical protein
MIRLAPLLLLVPLAGCATANMDCTDLRQGACKLSFARFATDTSASLTGPNGFSLSYSSNPQAEATAQAFAAFNRLAGLVARQQPPAEDEADGVAWRGPYLSAPRSVPLPARLSVPESCPAPPQWTMQRVTV